MNRYYKIGIVATVFAVVLISIPVYLFWMYSPEAVYRRGLASAFWLSLDNDTRDISVSKGETKTASVELHHWKDIETALYVELRSDGRDMDEYPSGLSVSYDLDSSVISLSKGAVMVQSKNEEARFNPPMIKQISTDGDIVVRGFGNLLVSVSNDVPLGSYYFELSTGDTKINGGGGNSQLLTVNVVDNDIGLQPVQRISGFAFQNSTNRTTVAIDVGIEPKQNPVQSGMGSTLMTKYLPVNVTQTVHLAQSTENITIYPVLTDWDGIVRPENDMKSLIYDENKNPIPFDGFGHLSLHAVNATCIEPYPVKVDTEIEEDGITIENSTIPVSSAIYWGDTIEGSFEEPRNGVISFTEAGYGIVPADYNNKDDSTYRTNGAGNQEISGTYHLSFTSFYPATISLRGQAEVISFLEVVCAINEDSEHIQKSEFPHIYVYDVWFRVEK